VLTSRCNESLRVAWGHRRALESLRWSAWEYPRRARGGNPGMAVGQGPHCLFFSFLSRLPLAPQQGGGGGRGGGGQFGRRVVWTPSRIRRGCRVVSRVEKRKINCRATRCSRNLEGVVESGRNGRSGIVGRAMSVSVEREERDGSVISNASHGGRDGAPVEDGTTTRGARGYEDGGVARRAQTRKR
jgi:hypothetical protein